MPTQIKVWEIDKGQIIARDNAAFADSHREDELEGWITRSPDILGEKLLIIARQLIIPEIGRLDLLAMDENGKLIIIELKRDLGPREAVAQALDYASWLWSVSENEILARANEYLQKNSGDPERDLAQAFEDTFGKSVPELVCENHRIILVAAGLDASAERIVNYLARKSIDINAVFFNYAELSDGKQILVRSVLVPESIRTGAAGGESRMTETALMAMAEERKTTELVKVCRRMATFCNEECATTAKGSFRYWTHGGMVCGANASGQVSDPPAPPGELDVWMRTDKLAEAAGVAEEVIKQRLSNFKPFAGRRTMNFVIRLKTPQEAERLVSQLRELVATQVKQPTAVKQSTAAD
ncbi:MAG TPA: endonuclease NucS domain-containing protein [Terriglobales bacterium]|jgi:hypothetical protein|nr:endonuclease NucS domain-containing protein [Terriglobales bacterium]